MSTNLKKHLKEKTLPLHDWIEDTYFFSDIKNNKLSKEQYITLIKKLYEFISILEPKIQQFKKDFENNGLTDIENRLKKEVWLKEDLNFFNIQNTEKESIEFDTINNFDRAVGALYVLEGSTMGGMQIIKIAKNSIEDDISLKYYGSYLENTIPMWMTYANWLDNAEINKYDATLGAMEVFINLKKHLES